MGLIKFMTSIIMASLFVIAILGFVINFGDDNNAAVKLSEDEDFVLIRTEITNNLSGFEDDVDLSSGAFTKSTIESGDQVTVTGGQFKVGILSATRMITSILKGGFKKIFGFDTGFGVFLTALIGLIVWIFAMLGWKAWAGRNPGD